MNQTRQRHRSKAEREEILSEFLESGLTQREFCEERRIGLSTLQYWLRKTRELEDEEETVEAARLVEVQLETVSEAPWNLSPPSQETEYDIILPTGRRLVVRRGYDRGEVAVLLHLLEER